MKIRFHQWLAFFILTLFTDFEYDLSGIKIRPIDMFLLLVVGLRALAGITLFKPVKATIVFFIYIFLCFILINSLTKVTVSESIKETVQLFEYVILMFLIAESTNTEEKRVSFFNILLWGTGAIAVYAAVYNIANGHFSGFKELDSPKHSFAFFALLTTISFFSKPKKNILDFLLIGISYIVVFLGGERKGWAGLAIALSVFILLQLKYSVTRTKINSVMAFGFVFIILIIAMFSLISDPQFSYLNRQLGSITDVTGFFSQQAQSYESLSDKERIFMFNYGLSLFYQYPFFGIGIDQFIVFVTRASQGVITHDAHNFYLKILDEEGLIGFILYLAVLVNLFFGLIKLTKNKNKVISQNAQIAMALFLLGSVVNFFLAGKALSWLYLVLPCGIMLALKHDPEKSMLAPNSRKKILRPKKAIESAV